MRSQVRLLLALLAALAAAVALVACGGGGDSDSETADRSATEILRQTFAERGEGEGFSSGVLTVALDLELSGSSGAGGPVAIKLTGPFDVPEGDEMPKFDLDLSVDAGGQSLQGGAISTGDQGFLSFQGTDYRVPDALFAQFRDGFTQAQQESGKDASGEPSLQSLGIDPTDWLVDPQKAGTEEVGGAETEHITAGVDVPKLVDDLQTSAEAAGSAGGQDPQQTAQQLAALKDQIESATVDVFTGTDDLRLRRFVADLKLAGGGTATFTLELADLDEPQDIEAPSDAKPIDELVQQFQGLLGGAVAPSSGSGSASGGSAAQQRYLQCVQDAGQDLAKVQDCAQLLEP